MTICLVMMMRMTTWRKWKVIKQKNKKSSQKIKKNNTKMKTNNKTTPM